MKRRIMYVMLFFTIVVFCACQKKADDIRNIGSSPVSDFNAETINLDDLSTAIEISQTSKNIKLARGNYIYTYSKQTTLKDEKYVVYMSDMLNYTAMHKASPDDAYARTLELVSANDKSAIRAIKGFNLGKWQIKTKEDMAKAQQLMSDTNHLNSAKFAIAILPANDYIKNISKQIRKSDTIAVSGVSYKLTGIIHNGEKEPITHCLAMDVFYLTNLKIDR